MPAVAAIDAFPDLPVGESGEEVTVSGN